MRYYYLEGFIEAPLYKDRQRIGLSVKAYDGGDAVRIFRKRYPKCHTLVLWSFPIVGYRVRTITYCFKGDETR